MIMNLTEVTVVAPLDASDEYLAGLDARLGLKHDRHYPYGNYRHVAYRLTPGDADRVKGILDKLEILYTFGGTVEFDHDDPDEDLPENPGDQDQLPRP